jgi:NAD(P)-dependent dehydrogenase (short-subunit alcohol dehydrogenase family)
MARVFVTGSSTGLGLLAARWLDARGHEVTLHARSAERTDEPRAALPHAALVVGDLSRIDGMRQVAEQVNALGRHDAVIHNAGVYRVPDRIQTDDGLSLTFAVNVLAPYLLTALVERPDRLVYLTSGLQNGAVPDLGDAQWTRRRWDWLQAYSESKLHVTTLAFGVARRCPMCAPTRSARAGCRPGWAARARRTTSPSAPKPRPGSPRVTSRRPTSPAGTSSTGSPPTCPPPCATPAPRRRCSPTAPN